MKGCERTPSPLIFLNFSKNTSKNFAPQILNLGSAPKTGVNVPLPPLRWAHSPISCSAEAIVLARAILLITFFHFLSVCWNVTSGGGGLMTFQQNKTNWKKVLPKKSPFSSTFFQFVEMSQAGGAYDISTKQTKLEESGLKIPSFFHFVLFSWNAVSPEHWRCRENVKVQGTNTTWRNHF